jgi:hypothetical protein
MSNDSVKFCNVIIQEEEYYSKKQEEYLLKKSELDGKYTNSLIGVVITCLLFIILLIVGIVLLVIKNKKSKKSKKLSKIDIKQIISVILFIIACLCSSSSVVLSYFANKNKGDVDKLEEPVIDDKKRPCYSKAQNKLIADVVDVPKNKLGLDMDNIDVLSGNVGVFTYSEDSSEMLDLSGSTLKRNESQDKSLSYSLDTRSDSSASASSISDGDNEAGPSTATASASGGTTSQVDLLI